jgi:hypothetical protein
MLKKIASFAFGLSDFLYSRNAHPQMKSFSRITSINPLLRITPNPRAVTTGPKMSAERQGASTTWTSWKRNHRFRVKN